MHTQFSSANTKFTKDNYELIQINTFCLTYPLYVSELIWYIWLLEQHIIAFIQKSGFVTFIMMTTKPILCYSYYDSLCEPVIS